MNLRRSISTNTHITITKVCRIYFLPRFILSFFICSHSSVKLISGSVLLTVDTYIVSMRTHRKSAASFFLRFFFSRFLSFSRFLFFFLLSLSLILPLPFTPPNYRSNSSNNNNFLYIYI